LSRARRLRARRCVAAVICSALPEHGTRRPRAPVTIRPPVEAARGAIVGKV
jgi:hypothetical protein